MNTLVLYESKFGNTERVAEAIALVLQESVPTRLAAVSDVDDCAEALQGISLLVVGGPTHRHGVSTTLQETLACLEDHALEGVKVATFDTRLHGPRVLTGSAGVGLERFLRKHGAWVVVPPMSFLVGATEGPLDSGELEHARAWTIDVLRAIGVRPHEPAAA
jgi:menaquinone-dependent protoporphyrinogen IX oxidase